MLGVLLVLSGCAEADDGETEELAPKATPSPGTSSADAGDVQSTDPHPSAEPPLPPGRMWVEAPQTGLRFAVPRTWTRLSNADLEDPTVSDAVSRYADSADMSVRFVRRSIRTNDLIGWDTQRNISTSVAQLPLWVLPDEKDVEDFARAAGGVPASRLEPVTTRAAPGRQVLITLPNRTFATTLFLDVEDGVVAVTVSARSPSASTDLMRQVRRTVHTTD